MKAHWDERYNSEDFAYGENPNVFLKETEVELSEGSFHVGLGSVIRFIGRKE